MDQKVWPIVFFYGSILITIVLFLILADRKKIKHLIPVGLLIAAEHYTVEVIGLHYDVWDYPLPYVGYPEVVILSSLVYFPVFAMLFYQYLTENVFKNILLIAIFVSINMAVEVITLKTTDIFVYGKNMNLVIALFMYIFAYVLVMIFKKLYHI